MLADQFIDLYESTKDEYDRGDVASSQDIEKINGQYFSSSTVLFCDFIGFTQKTEKIQPGELVEILDTFLSVFKLSYLILLILSDNIFLANLTSWFGTVNVMLAVIPS